MFLWFNPYFSKAIALITSDPNYYSTILLLHLDGTSGTVSSVTDNSPNNTTLSIVGTPSYNTTTFKFGTASLNTTYTSTTNKLVTPSSSVFSFDTGNFTMECWAYCTNVTTYNRLFGNGTGSAFTTGNWLLGIDSSPAQKLVLYVFPTSTVVATSGTTSLSNNTWYHIAFVRNGTNFYVFLNGNLEFTYTSSASLDGGGTKLLNIGSSGQGPSNPAFETWNGYIDDVRITKGVARYTSNFTVPSEAFPNVGPSILEYPPTAMTSDTTTISAQAYGNGTYISSASTTQAGSFPYVSFDKANTTGGIRWISATSIYSLSTGLYAGSVTSSVSGSNYSGEYLQIQLPLNIILTSYKLTSLNYTSQTFYLSTPNTWVIAGSTNGTTWNLLDTQTSQVYSAYNVVKTFNITNSAAYNYYRLIATAIQASNPYGQVEIGEWQLFGATTITTNEYPPVALSTSSLSTTVSGQVYGNGTYVVSYSSEGFAGAGYYLYDKVANSLGGSSYYATGYNSGTPGNYSSTTYSTVASGTTYYGQWHSLQLPTTITVTGYSIQATNDVVARNPASWIVAGSTNGTTWTLLDSQSGYVWTGNQVRTFSITSGSYSYLRILFQSIQGSDAAIQVGEVKWFGY